MGNTMVRRSRKTGAILVFMLVFGIVLGVLPAMAAASSTAFVNIHNVLADQSAKVFSVRVNNTEPQGVAGQVGVGRTINEVRIRGPVDLIDAVLTGSSGPAAFSQIALIGSPPAEIRFQVPSGQTGGIAPGGNATFTVVADIRDSMNRDRTDFWRVRVSNDRGLNFQGATALGEGLATNVRVLQVQNVAVVSPSGAADDRDGDGNPEVTGTQGNVCVRSRVFNASASALTVSPSLSGSNVNVGPARPATPAAPCSGTPLEGGSVSIPGGTSSDFDFLVSFGNVGSRTNAELTGTATAPGASTPATPDPDDDDFTSIRDLIIEPKSVLTYEPESLKPRAVVPSDLAEGFTNRKSFTIDINKRPNGSPPLPTLAGNFASVFCNANLASPTSLGASQLTTQAAFAECPIADIDDGRYRPTVNYSYTDANGLVQGLTALTPQLETVRLDSLIPSVDIDINPPTPHVTAVPPVEPAVTNGTAFTASGTVTDRSPETDQQLPCGPGNQPGSTTALPCKLQKVELIQYPLTAKQGGGTALQRRIDVTNRCSLSSTGNLSCNINLPEASGFDTGVQATEIFAMVTDETENEGKDDGELIDVDIIDPQILSATTARGGSFEVAGQQVAGQRRTVVVKFNEPVQNSNVPQDWVIQDGTAKAVCNVNQSADKRTVNLITCQELSADVEQGTLTYDPSLPGSSPYHDRVNRQIDVPDEKSLTDGIAPLAPTFGKVDGRDLQDGAYYFNNNTPRAELTNGSAPEDDPAVKVGYTLEVYEETDGTDGLNRLTDTPICGPEVANGPVHLLSCEFNGAERQAKIYAISLDRALNEGASRITSFVLDMTRPLIGSASVSGTQITVDFTEPVPKGTDAAGNWTYFANVITDPGQRTSPDVHSVAAGSTNAQRRITYDDQHHAPSTLDPDELRYFFSAGDVYEDRAGNALLNVNFHF